jgi:hypothetical protein
MKNHKRELEPKILLGLAFVLGLILFDAGPTAAQT